VAIQLQEFYDNCVWSEGELHDAGISMNVGGLEPVDLEPGDPQTEHLSAPDTVVAVHLN